MPRMFKLTRAAYRKLPVDLRRWLAGKGIPDALARWLLAFGLRRGSAAANSPHTALYRSMVERAGRGLAAIAPASPPQDATPPPGTQGPRLIAWYLPQYHPTPDNDRFWGEGFTDWHNVAKAVPQFAGHQQPRRPATLGYYDLRLEETMVRQVEMARAHGLTAFAFHYYAFGHRRALEKPLDLFLANASGRLDMNFVLSWANENWTRRWDGRETAVLIRQTNDPEALEAVFAGMRRYLADPRYLRVDGRPLLIVYRPAQVANLSATMLRWRAMAVEAGLGGLYLVATDAFTLAGDEAHAFDAVCRFPPHGAALDPANHEQCILNPDFRGTIYRYGDLVELERQRLDTRTARDDGRAYFPGVMPGWDNEARRPGRGTVFAGATPKLYASWLDHALRASQRLNPPDRQFVFINAWNEWAEGAYLEPDMDNGFAYLAATGEALASLSSPGC